MSALQKHKLRDLYRLRAGRYDLTANLYYLIGFREYAYRRKAVQALSLSRGNTVVELSCGTGLNFSLLQAVVGEEGRIIGVDLTDRMLDKAAERIAAHRWSNVRLIQSDASEYDCPENVDGILSTFAITLIPEYESIIRRGSEALRPGGRWVVLDFKLPEGPWRALVPLALLITKPFGVTLDLADRHPWESIETHMEHFVMDDLYGGFAYIASGWNGTPPPKRIGMQ